MEQKKSRKEKRRAVNKRFVTLLAAIFLLTTFVVYSVHFALQTSEMKDQIAELSAKIEEQKRLKLSNEEELARIDTPQYYEYLARKLLGYIYEGETVMVVSDEMPAEEE